MKKLSVCLLAIHLSIQLSAQQPIFQTAAFSIYNDKVVQGKNEAKAISATHMVSNYQSPANQFQSANISFKFSINGRDNEMFMGKNHNFTVNAANGISETPLIKFGTQLDQPTSDGKYLSPNTA